MPPKTRSSVWFPFNCHTGALLRPPSKICSIQLEISQNSTHCEPCTRIGQQRSGSAAATERACSTRSSSGKCAASQSLPRSDVAQRLCCKIILWTQLYCELIPQGQFWDWQEDQQHWQQSNNVHTGWFTNQLCSFQVSLLTWLIFINISNTHPLILFSGT